MLEGIALIIAAYAAARLLNEYVLTAPNQATIRIVVAIFAIVAVVYGFVAVADKASQVSNLIP